MAKAALGVKRVCVSCAARFYDLNKRPIECPKCGAAFEPEVLLRSRRTRTPDKKEAMRPAPAEVEDEALVSEEAEEAEETEDEDAAPAEEVSLEEAEAESGDEAAEDEGAGDIDLEEEEIESDDDEDDELIEELDDEDDEIDDIIDADIEDDKER